MSAKYSKLPTDDPDSMTIDFSSIFSYDYPKYFSYSPGTGTQSQYKSMFTYSGDHQFNKDCPVERQTPSVLFRCCGILITIVCYILIGLTLPFSAWCSFKKIQEHERLIIFRLGRLLATKGPGLVVLLPCIDKWYSVDLKTRAFSIPPVKLLTADGATIEVGGDVYFHIFDPLLSVTNVQDLNHSTRILSQTLLQRKMGNYDLKDIEMSKLSILDALLPDINKMTRTWGVKLERIEMSQVRVIAQPNPMVNQSTNPLSFLGPLLFPSGTGDAPLQQLQQQFAQLYGQQSPATPATLAAPGPAAVAPQAVDVSPGNTVTPQTTQESEYQTPQDLMQAIKPHLNAALVADFGCVYKFVVQSITGDEVIYLDLKNGDGSVNSGEPPDGTTADVTMTLTLDDFRCLIKGQMSAFAAYMTGRLSVTGDLTLANRLAELIDHIK